MLPTIPRKEFVVKNKFYPNKGKLTIMPFTVAQEAIVLQVKDSDDPQEQLVAIKQLIEGCVKEKIDIDSLPTFVLEELFIRLREISVGEIVPLNYQCKAKYTRVDEESKEEITETCNSLVEFKFDLREFKLKESENHNNIVMVTDTIGIKLRYPTLDNLADFDVSSDENELYISCIESVFEGDEVHPASESSHDELMTFFKSLSSSQKSAIAKTFLYTMPKLHFETDIVCPKCGNVNHLSFNSLSDVFI